MADAPAPEHLPLKLPTSPYPGLRPFLDHEDMLMNGRQAQIEDIVARLGPTRRQPNRAQDALADDAPPATRFVAVIGGSGSGKSSLIRAGVVPYLRQYGIPAAGDLWEIVVATPGTNFQADADGLVHESPITRLARKFERVLRGPRDASRCTAIEQALRRPGGLGRMVELFGAELDLPDGLQPDKACVLLVIDQFEELFHKSNLGQPDATQLVERVIDHYHQAKVGAGHDKCYLAITMRSEHLNDCAGYLGLPEAINAGSYLVSRLDDRQLREVIEKPAQRFLRLRQRARQVLLRHAPETDAASLPALPAAVVFEDGVVERLVTDARRMANDPDHLPLLQHALARTWEAACARSGLAENEGAVPQKILLLDLWRAAQAVSEAPLPATDNLLQLSLDRWAQAMLDSHPAEQQATVQELLRRLTYKDTRTGTYNQQRLYVAQHPLGEQALHTMLKGRWIDGVDYLYWDNEDPQRVTLKVSHESFIRGWKSLRKLADDEARRFEQFMQLLGATRAWAEHGRLDQDLLDDRMLRRLADAGIEEAVGPRGATHDAYAAGQTWREWHGWLGQLPQGQALLDVERAAVRAFYHRSLQALDKAQARGRTTRLTLVALSMAVVVTLVGTAFALLVQQPVIDRADLYFKAANLANTATLRNAYPEIGGNQVELESLLAAAGLVDQAAAHPGKRGSFSDALLHGSWSPLQGLRLATLLSEAARAVEPPVNGKLRALLTRSIWRTASLQPGDSAQLIDAKSNEPLFNATCDRLTGILKPVEGGRSDDNTRRGVFVSTGRLFTGPGGEDGRNNLMYAASVSANGQCTLGRQLQALPSDREPAVMFDATLGYMLLAVDGNVSAPATVSVHRVVWDDPDQGLSAEIHQPLAVVFNTQTAGMLRQQVRQRVGMADITWRMPAGRAMRVGSEDWRLVADGAQRLVPQPARSELRPLQEDRDDRPCEAVRQQVEQELAALRGQTPEQGPLRSRLAVFRDQRSCLVVLRSALIGMLAGRDQVNLRAYAMPGRRDLDPQGRLTKPAAVISSFDYGRVRAMDSSWFAGLPGTAYDGWLVLHRQPNQRQSEARFNGVPWSTLALLNLGRAVLTDHHAQTGPWQVEQPSTRSSTRPSTLPASHPATHPTPPPGTPVSRPATLPGG